MARMCCQAYFHYLHANNLVRVFLKLRYQIAAFGALIRYNKYRVAPHGRGRTA